MAHCKWCKIECKKFFCSKKCNNAFHHERGKIETKCENCGKIVIRHYLDSRKYKSCFECSMKKRIAPNQDGDKNPAWRGGFKYWQEGKLGKDKDGLSWKKQRRLVWERDNYTCQICGEGKVKRNPDVHHKIPYRISKSHNLENLISLCKKCHKSEDEKYKQIV